eukprot:843471-Alexandrium_andersonii.AAC.1
MLPETGLVSVTHTQDHESALAYPLPPPAVPAVVATLAASADGAAPRLAALGGSLLLCGVPPALTRMVEDQLGLDRWIRSARQPVQLWRGMATSTGSF